METKSECLCSSAPALIFSCSGAADLGEIADRAARKLTSDGAGKMYCLAGVGGHISGILASTQAAERILAIDGCPMDCALKTLEHAGFDKVSHVRITDLGLDKGKSPATNERIELVASKCAEMLSCSKQEENQ